MVSALVLAVRPPGAPRKPRTPAQSDATTKIDRPDDDETAPGSPSGNPRDRQSRGSTRYGSSYRKTKPGTPKRFSSKAAKALRVGGTKKKSKAKGEDDAVISPWVLGLLVFVVVGSAIVGIFSNASSGPPGGK